jgi:lysine/ornithine N-monooxygenase
MSFKVGRLKVGKLLSKYYFFNFLHRETRKLHRFISRNSTLALAAKLANLNQWAACMFAKAVI